MKHKKLWALLFTILGAAVLIVVTALGTMQRRTENLHDDWQLLLNDPAYQDVVQVDGVGSIRQDVSCGYAVIELMSAWTNGDVTEETLLRENGGVTTSSSEGFEEELDKRIPGYEFERLSYLPDAELLVQLHKSLSSGMPVPVEWAAKDGEKWTLHYSLVTGMDLTGDEITVVNPYGYTEEISVDEFLDRTSFEAFEGMPFGYQLGFAFGFFDKNTIFVGAPVQQSIH